MLLEATFLMLVPFLGAVLATYGLCQAIGVPVIRSHDQDYGNWYFAVFFLAVGSVPLLGLLLIVMNLQRP